MARDKYFNNHGRKNRFYAKGDLCRHEYIEKYYPIYDQARIPQLGRRWDKEKYYVENICGNRINCYYDTPRYCHNDNRYTDYMCGCYGGCCYYNLYHAFCYGRNKYYIYKQDYNDDHYYPHKYKHIDTRSNYCSRGCRHFKTCPHNIEHSELIYKKQKEYPGCIIYTNWDRSYYNLQLFKLDKYFVYNYLIYINYNMYKEIIIKYIRDKYSYLNSYIIRNISDSPDIFNKYIITEKYDRYCLVIYNIGKIFTDIWNKRRYAIMCKYI